MTPGTAAPRDCPTCGSPAAQGQEYCLECGSRLPADPAAAGVRRRWLASGGPIAALLATGAVAVVAATAVAAVQRQGGETERMLVATSPQPEVAPPTAAEPVEEALPETDAEAEEPPPPPAQQPRRGGGRLVQWPEGESGWTVVIASVPTGGGNRAVATREARAALDAGLPDVGVLVSSEFSSLHPGYFVVFSGIYPNRSAAEEAFAQARDAGHTTGYTREVVP